MSLILSLETTTKVCSVALYDSDTLLTETSLSIEKAHSQFLASLVDSTFKYSHQNKSALSAVAISSGPGSYTGLRIGTSFAKGICFSMNIPLISINTLDGMIQLVKRENEKILYCPMLDARRMEVYCKVENDDGIQVEDTHARIIEENSFLDLLDKNVILFFGDGSAKCKSILNHKNARFQDKFQISAKGIGELAYSKFENEEFEDVAYFEPFYLKEYKAGKPKPLIA